jgi:hypothetical protein
MTELEFNPGHLEAIREFLGPNEEPLTPEMLASQATTIERVEVILEILQQELSNTAMPVQFFEYLVEDIDAAASKITEENAEKLADFLHSFQEILRKATVNAQLIIDCLSRIRQIEETTQAAGLPSLFSEKSQQYASLLQRDSEMITKAFEGKLEAYNRSYENGLAKLTAFLESDGTDQDGTS